MSSYKTDNIVLSIKNSNVNEIKEFLDKNPDAIKSTFYYDNSQKRSLIDYLIQFEGSIECLDLLLSRGARPNNITFTFNQKISSPRHKEVSIRYFFLLLLYANENNQMKKESYEIVIGTKIIYCCLKKIYRCY